MIDKEFRTALEQSLAELPIAEFYLGGEVPEGLPALEDTNLEGPLEEILPEVLEELEKSAPFAEARAGRVSRMESLPFRSDLRRNTNGVDRRHVFRPEHTGKGPDVH